MTKFFNALLEDINYCQDTIKFYNLFKKLLLESDNILLYFNII